MSSVLLAILVTGPAMATSAAAVHGGSAQNIGTIAMVDNPFRAPSTRPYQLPPFDKIEDSSYLPAFEAGMRWWGNAGQPPLNNVMFVSGFWPADFLILIDAIAVVPQPG